MAEGSHILDETYKLEAVETVIFRFYLNRFLFLPRELSLQDVFLRNLCICSSSQGLYKLKWLVIY